MSEDEVHLLEVPVPTDQLPESKVPRRLIDGTRLTIVIADVATATAWADSLADPTNPNTMAELQKWELSLNGMVDMTTHARITNKVKVVGFVPAGEGDMRKMVVQAAFMMLTDELMP